MTAALVLHRQRTRALAWCLGVAVLLGLGALAGVALGSVSLPASDVWAVTSHHLFDSPLPSHLAASTDAIVWQVRVPRVLLAIVAGAGLSTAGVALQALVRNPLADPYVLGVNSGASVGAAACIVLGLGAGLGAYALQTSAFIGAACAMALVLVTAGRRASAPRLLLAGVAVGYALSAATSFLIFAAQSAEGSRSVMFWLLGSLGLAAWDGPLALAAAATAGGIGMLCLLARRLDALALGDDTALSLGFDPTRLRVIVLLVTSLLVGAAVATAGSIGFVGLVVPHLARRLVGARHAAVLPVSALLGALLLVVADIAARMVLAPQEVPIGVITALTGTPALIILIHRMHRSHA